MAHRRLLERWVNHVAHPEAELTMNSTWTLLSGCPGWTTPHYQASRQGTPTGGSWNLVAVGEKETPTGRPTDPVEPLLVGRGFSDRPVLTVDAVWICLDPCLS